MTESVWRLLYFDSTCEEWIEEQNPSLSDIARLRNWRHRVETEGLAVGTIYTDDEKFVARVPDTRVVVAGVAIPFEFLLIVHKIWTLTLAD